jgi:crotonobetainyl-CoA:carnitine CoA-transferase CaiB-like acyl-CoA transferase
VQARLSAITKAGVMVDGVLRQTGKIPRAAPLLGEHTEEALMGLAYSKEEIADLRERKII